MLAECLRALVGETIGQEQTSVLQQGEACGGSIQPREGDRAIVARLALPRPASRALVMSGASSLRRAAMAEGSRGSRSRTG
jgi:hypothetical protein